MWAELAFVHIMLSNSSPLFSGRWEVCTTKTSKQMTCAHYFLYNTAWQMSGTLVRISLRWHSFRVFTALCFAEERGTPMALFSAVIFIGYIPSYICIVIIDWHISSHRPILGIWGFLKEYRKRLTSSFYRPCDRRFYWWDRRLAVDILCPSHICWHHMGVDIHNPWNIRCGVSLFATLIDFWPLTFHQIVASACWEASKRNIQC